MGVGTLGPLGLPIGVQLYTVNSGILADAAAALRRLAQMGYREVETAGFGSLGSARNFRRELDANGLACPSAHLQFDLSNLSQAFDEALELGCTYATTSVPRMLLWPPRGDPYGLSPDELTALFQKIVAPMPPGEFKRTAEALNVVGEAAREAGLRFAAHNHTMELAPMDGKTGLDYLLAQTDPGLVNFELDWGWAAIQGFNPSAWVNRYPGRITMLHIRDFEPYQGTEPATLGTARGMELGCGFMDYKPIFSSLEGKGIEHIFVEQDGPFERMSAMDAAKVGFDYLRSLATA